MFWLKSIGEISMFSGIAGRLLIFRNVYVIFIANGEQHNIHGSQIV